MMMMMMPFTVLEKSVLQVERGRERFCWRIDSYDHYQQLWFWLTGHCTKQPQLFENHLKLKNHRLNQDQIIFHSSDLNHLRRNLCLKSLRMQTFLMSQ
jgi:hypothetical protein